MINSRKIEDLLPDVAAKANSFKAKCAGQGIDVLITSTYRDVEYQNHLYAQGRSKPGKIVTKVRGGDSMHNYHVAFDFVPMRKGEPVWGDDTLWGVCGAIAGQCGLEWGGNWTSFVDKPHCQDTGGRTLAQLKAAHVTA